MVQSEPISADCMLFFFSPFFSPFFFVVPFFCHKKRRCGALWSSIIYARKMVLPPTYGVRAYLMIFNGCAEGAICDFFVLPTAG